jgi:hypothetical protein
MTERRRPEKPTPTIEQLAVQTAITGDYDAVADTLDSEVLDVITDPRNTRNNRDIDTTAITAEEPQIISDETEDQDVLLVDDSDILEIQPLDTLDAEDRRNTQETPVTPLAAIVSRPTTKPTKRQS